MIYEYYSSNSSTSKHTDLTRVITSVCRQSTHVRGPVTASLVTSAIDVSVFVRAASTRACAVRCMRFLAYFLRFRCLNVTTLFNINVKIRNTFSCRRDCQLLCCHSAPLLRTYLLFNTCSRYFSLHFLVYTVEFQHVNSQLCVAMMVFALIYVAQM